MLDSSGMRLLAGQDETGENLLAMHPVEAHPAEEAGVVHAVGRGVEAGGEFALHLARTIAEPRSSAHATLRFGEEQSHTSHRTACMRHPPVQRLRVFAGPALLSSPWPWRRRALGARTITLKLVTRPAEMLNQRACLL